MAEVGGKSGGVAAILHNSSYGYQGKYWTCVAGSVWRSSCTITSIMLLCFGIKIKILACFWVGVGAKCFKFFVQNLKVFASVGKAMAFLFLSKLGKEAKQIQRLLRNDKTGFGLRGNNSVCC